MQISISALKREDSMRVPYFVPGINGVNTNTRKQTLVDKSPKFQEPLKRYGDATDDAKR